MGVFLKDAEGNVYRYEIYEKDSGLPLRMLENYMLSNDECVKSDTIVKCVATGYTKTTQTKNIKKTKQSKNTKNTAQSKKITQSKCPPQNALSSSFSRQRRKKRDDL